MGKDEIRLGFWNWCKENHPEIIIEWHKELKKGMESLEKFLEDLKENRGGSL